MDFENILSIASQNQGLGEVQTQQKRYSLQTGPPKKVPQVKGVNSSAVQAFLKKQELQNRKKEIEKKKAKEELTAKRVELKSDRKARAMASRTKDNFHGYNGIPVVEEPKKRRSKGDKNEDMPMGRPDNDYYDPEDDEDNYEYEKSDSEPEPEPVRPSKASSSSGYSKSKPISKKPAGPPPSFAELLKLAEKKQFEPVEIKTKLVKADERLRTADEIREMELERRAKGLPVMKGRDSRPERERDRETKLQSSSSSFRKGTLEKEQRNVKSQKGPLEKPTLPVGSGNRPKPTFSSDRGHSSAKPSHSDRPKPSPSDRDRQKPPLSDRDRQKPSSSDRDRQKPCSSDRDRQKPSSSDGDRQKPYPSDRDRPKPSPSDRDRQKPSPSDRDRPKTSHSDKDRPRSGLSNSSGALSSKVPSKGASSQVPHKHSDPRPSSGHKSSTTSDLNSKKGPSSLPQGRPGGMRPPVTSSMGQRPQQGGSGQPRPSQGNTLKGGSTGGGQKPGKGEPSRPGGSSVVKSGNNGQMRPANNGQMRPANNGQMRPANNGQVKPANNGQVRPANNGQMRPVNNGQMRPGNDGQMRASSSGTSKQGSQPQARLAGAPRPGGNSLQGGAIRPPGSGPSRPGSGAPGRPAGMMGSGPGRPKCTVVSETISTRDFSGSRPGVPPRPGMQQRPGMAPKPGMPPRQMMRPPGTTLPPITSAYKRQMDDEEEDEYDSEMEDFIDDGDDDQNEISRHIKEIFGYDRTRYKDESDYALKFMESSWRDQQKEEARSLKMAVNEDLEEEKRELDEMKRAAKRRKIC